MVPETDRAYIAGLFDGEGSIHFKRGMKRKRNTKANLDIDYLKSMRIVYGNNHDRSICVNMGT